MSPQLILTRKVNKMTFYGKDSIYFDHIKKCHINVSLLMRGTGFTVFPSIMEPAVTEENTAGIVWRQEGETI